MSWLRGIIQAYKLLVGSKEPLELPEPYHSTMFRLIKEIEPTLCTMWSILGEHTASSEGEKSIELSVGYLNITIKERK